MIAYLDTSALVKAYVQEAGTDQVPKHLHNADISDVHEIAYVEARSNFARLFREEHLTRPEFDQLKAEFESDRSKYTIITSNSELLQRGADMAEAFALHAYDSIHLAAAEYLATGIDETVTFLCFDRKLCQAASVLRMHLVDNWNT